MPFIAVYDADALLPNITQSDPPLASHPADGRAVQLSLTEHRSAVTGRAIAVVRRLLAQPLAPLGGLGGRRTEVFARELTALLDAPLDSPTKE